MLREIDAKSRAPEHSTLTHEIHSWRDWCRRPPALSHSQARITRALSHYTLPYRRTLIVCAANAKLYMQLATSVSNEHRQPLVDSNLIISPAR